MKKRTVLNYLVIVLCSVLYLLIGSMVTDRHLSYDEEMEVSPLRAKVVEITADSTIDSVDDYGKEVRKGEIYFKAEIKKGEQKGEIVAAVQTFDEYMTIVTPRVEKGDKVILYPSQMYDYGQDYIFTEFIRSDAMVYLAAAFCLILVLFGKWKGLTTLIALAFTCLAVFQVFIPAVLSGYNPYFWAVLTCIFTTVMTIYLVGGINQKANVAILGCLGGVFFAGILMLFINHAIQLSGLTGEDSMYLVTAIPDRNLDLIGIAFAGIIIGAMGAIMDVSMSIASSLSELKEKNPNLSAKELLHSGIVISRDIMGTMANTLILAYIGSSLPSALLLFAYYSSIPLELFNMEMIVFQILQALVGSMGILLALPLTSVLGAVFLAKKRPKAVYAERFDVRDDGYDTRNRGDK